MTILSGNSSGNSQGSDSPFPAFPPFPEGESGKARGGLGIPDEKGKRERESGNSLILAIDPGTTHSGWASYEKGRVMGSGVLENSDLLRMLPSWHASGGRLAIEMIASYGMAVGREVFETCVWIGRFMQAWEEPSDVRLVYRKDVKLHLCNSPRAKDANIRQALLDKVGPQGTKNSPGPTYGVRSHAWAALAVAVTVADPAYASRATHP